MNGSYLTNIALGKSDLAFLPSKVNIDAILTSSLSLIFSNIIITNSKMT